MSQTLLVLLVAGLVLLMAGAGAGLLLLRLRDRQQALKKRIEAVSVAHSRARSIQALPITRRRIAEPLPLVRQVSRVFGYDPAGSDEGMRWYLVLPATLAVSGGIAQLATALAGNAAFLAVLPCWVALSRSLWGWRREKRLGLLRTQFPDALAMIVRSVRVGIPVAEAIHIVAREACDPTARNFGALAAEIAIGVPLESALPQLAERTGLAEYRFFATAIGLQSQTGGALSETLEGLADVTRRRLALRARGHALSSEARASCMMLAALPFLVGGALYALSPAYIGVLFTDPTGRHLLGLAVLALGAGLFSMRTIIRSVLA